MSLPQPFEYPKTPHVRRHGPQGYGKYQLYKNWLRDEFTFRCIYCLRRETWLLVSRDHSIDHFLPKSTYPGVALAYDNLVYACSACNGTKAARLLPSPEEIAYGKCLSVNSEGEIKALNEEGETIIEVLRLDAACFTRMRKNILDAISEAPSGGKTLQWCLGFPDDLPDLATERIPKTNTRPSGISSSHLARKNRGELPDYY